MGSDEKEENGELCSQSRLHLFESGKRQRIWQGSFVWGQLASPSPKFTFSIITKLILSGTIYYK